MDYRLATLSKHGRRLQANGWLPLSMPECFRVRGRTAEDKNVPESYALVSDDYDGNGPVALKLDDVEWLEPAR